MSFHRHKNTIMHTSRTFFLATVNILNCAIGAGYGVWRAFFRGELYPIAIQKER